jgi:hypothetical protein
MSDLNLMTISLQAHTKTPAKLKFCDYKFALRSGRVQTWQNWPKTLLLSQASTNNPSRQKLTKSMIWEVT